MFGYLIVNPVNLSKEDKNSYRSFYCGLCKMLNEKYGNLGRTTLTYDFTYITILLSSINNKEFINIKENCPLHMLVKQDIRYNEFSSYCADMNIYYSYFKLLDNYHDDNDKKSYKKAKKLEKYITKIENKYPDICRLTKTNLDKITETEKRNILNPEINMHLFGQIMAEIFAYNCSDNNLKAFGYHIGRFIYLMDAVMDFKKDIKNQAYNPLIQIPSNQYKDMLMDVMEQADIYYQKLNVNANKDILDNIFYSGLWSQYEIKNKKEKK